MSAFWLTTHMLQDRQIRISERRVGLLVAELRKAGYLIGSRCDYPNGYFLCETPEDVERGLAHIVARAAESFAIVKAQRAAAAERLGPQTLSLFDIGEAS